MPGRQGFTESPSPSFYAPPGTSSTRTAINGSGIRALYERRTIRPEVQALADAMAFIVTHPFTRRSQAAINWTTLFAQFNQLTPRVLIARIQLDRSRICHKRSLDIVRRFVTVSKAVPCIRGIGIGLCVQFEQHDG